MVSVVLVHFSAQIKKHDELLVLMKGHRLARLLPPLAVARQSAGVRLAEGAWLLA